MKNEPIASGINIGKNSEPNPTRWNMIGRATAQAAVIDAIIICVIVISSCININYRYYFMIKNILFVILN
jgi:hypothetical protein